MSINLITPFIVLLLIVILGYSSVGIFLIIRAYKTQLKNLYLIGIGFILVTIGIVGNLLLEYGRLFQVVFLGVGYSLLAIFIYQTFHKKKSNSYAKLMLSLIIVLFFARILVGVVKTLVLTPITYYIDLIIVNTFVNIIFYWLGRSASKDYRKLKKKDIEPWIKARYRIIAFSAYIFLFQGLSTFLVPWNVNFGDPSNILSFIQLAIAVILGLIFCIGMIMSWIMPKRLKSYINLKNGYISSDGVEISEDNLMEILKKQLMGDDNNPND
ncbi:MAG: hypothetical protein ACW96X_04825 [Promethearchaeota archaeon]|jgi:hypothetical protein